MRHLYASTGLWVRLYFSGPCQLLTLDPYPAPSSTHLKVTTVWNKWTIEENLSDCLHSLYMQHLPAEGSAWPVDFYGSPTWSWLWYDTCHTACVCVGMGMERSPWPFKKKICIWCLQFLLKVDIQVISKISIKGRYPCLGEHANAWCINT